MIQSRWARVAALAGLVALGWAAITYGLRTPAVVPAIGPASEFSAERAMKHVLVISSRAHPSGSEGHAAVQNYIVGELKALYVTQVHRRLRL